MVGHHYRFYALCAQGISGYGQGQGRVDAAGQPQHHAPESVLLDVIAHPHHQRLVDARLQFL
ncbi:hypothetical protein D3C85_1744510 [compost metagenome]